MDSPKTECLPELTASKVEVEVEQGLGPVSPTVVNFNRRFSPHFNLQLAYICFTNAS